VKYSNITICVVTAAITFAALPAPAEENTGKSQLAGAWLLKSFKATTGDQVNYPLGEHPGGYVGFSPTRFWVMLVDTTRKAPASAAMTDAEAASFMKSSAAYTGKYVADPIPTPDGIKITIHVDAAANQALTGTDRVLFVRIDGDELTLKSPAIVIPTTGKTSVVQLDFVKAD
jgi:Lipocalin-like domain